MNTQKDKNLATDERPVPSQAEGERQPGAEKPANRPVPSQAEGDRETIEEDLESK